jgi:beta-lactamase regulating signal transducer with metallopeptidase domain
MSTQTIQTLGQVLLHFLWQGAALAGVLSIAISFTRNARIRYGLGVCTLTLMALCPLATLLFLAQPSTPSVTLDDSQISPLLSNITVALSSTASAKSLDLLGSLVCLWLSGVCLFAVRAFGGWIVLQKLRRTAQESLSPALLERCRRLQQRIGIRTAVRYAHSEIVDAPAVVGWFRPLVLIPLSAIAGLSTEQLEAIVSHELAHIRRYDALVNLFQVAVETVLFYHPAVWWVNRLIRVERENCCDDIAVEVCGNPGDYARALAAMGAARPTFAMAANGGALKARVGRLLGIQKITHGMPRAGLAVLAVLSASCVLLAAGAFKQEAPPPPPPTPPPPSVEPTPPAPPFPPVPPKKRLAELERGRIETPPSAPPQKAEEPHTGSYIEGLESAGLTNLSVDELISLKVQGVTPDYIRDIRATGLKPTVRDLISMKVQGVTPEFIRALQSAGLGELRMRDFITAKVQGLTPEFIEKVRNHGFKDLTFRQLIGLKVSGVF